MMQETSLVTQRFEIFFTHLDNYHHLGVVVFRVQELGERQNL